MQTVLIWGDLHSSKLARFAHIIAIIEPYHKIIEKVSSFLLRQKFELFQHERPFPLAPGSMIIEKSSSSPAVTF
jgi:hypothetical protein